MSGQKTVRVGRVVMYLRGQVWYLRYHENGRRRQVRASNDKTASRQLAAQVNAQLETGAPAATSFEPVSIPELRRRWLDHHEQVRRSSLATINRYRTATDHLLHFVEKAQPVRCASHFRATHAESFVRYLRSVEVAPNGHANTAKRKLRDKGLKFVLETCRSLFNFAMKRRHLPPYAENPFTQIEIDRVPVEDAKPIVVFDGNQERRLLEACDDWQFPIVATLALTGLRPGELVHLLLPDDVDLSNGWLYVRNKPELGWKVKTRNERRIPLLAELVNLLRINVGIRDTGPLFLRRRFAIGQEPRLSGLTRIQTQLELERRIASHEEKADRPLDRVRRQKHCRQLWMDMGAIKPEVLRVEFMRITRAIGLPKVTAPKTLRHGFATCLQDANVDPLIRNQLMGHVSGDRTAPSGALGMTAVYTHTRTSTLREQFEHAMNQRPIVELLRSRSCALSRS